MLLFWKIKMVILASLTILFPKNPHNIPMELDNNYTLNLDLQLHPLVTYLTCSSLGLLFIVNFESLALVNCLYFVAIEHFILELISSKG